MHVRVHYCFIRTPHHKWIDIDICVSNIWKKLIKLQKQKTRRICCYSEEVVVVFFTCFSRQSWTFEVDLSDGNAPFEASKNPSLGRDSKFVHNLPLTCLILTGRIVTHAHLSHLVLGPMSTREKKLEELPSVVESEKGKARLNLIYLLKYSHHPLWWKSVFFFLKFSLEVFQGDGPVKWFRTSSPDQFPLLFTEQEQNLFWP